MMDATIVKLVEDAGVAIAVCCIFLVLVYRNNKSLINILIESNKDNSTILILNLMIIILKVQLMRIV